jgi:hypothetical protein
VRGGIGRGHDGNDSGAHATAGSDSSTR